MTSSISDQNEEAVDESSDPDDFLERTQNAKKNKSQAKKKNKTSKLANKYKGLNLKEITKADFKVSMVIHAKSKVKSSDNARTLKIESVATVTAPPKKSTKDNQQGLISSFCIKDGKKKDTTEKPKEEP